MEIDAPQQQAPWGEYKACAIYAFGEKSLDSQRFLVAGALVLSDAAKAADPIRVGTSLALTGGVAPIGKQVLAALQIWRDDVNAKGGLLGRPVELVFYDDQSNPANVPQLFTKLITVDKVDLLIGPYATNMVAPAIPVLMQYKKTTIGILANAANSKFHYDQYFSMLPTGPEPQKSFAYGFFELAAAASRGRRPWRSSLPMPNLPRTPLTARGRASRRSAASNPYWTRAIRLRRPTTRRSCARYRRLIPTSFSLPPIRRIRSASCAPPMKSGSPPKCSAAP